MRPMLPKDYPNIANQLKEQRGTITVFLLIIFAALLILAGLIVDATRILVAERKIDSALQSAARSVLADSDPDLAGQFGLYGVNYANKATELERYLLNNLQERHQGFAFVDYRIEKATLVALPEESLLNNEVFEQQILQYMKYKAPLRITENVVQKFRQGAFSKKTQAGKKATEAAQQSKVVRNKTVAVNKVIRTKGGTFKRGAQDRLKELEALQNNLAQIKGDLAVYRQLVDQSTEKLQEAEEVSGQVYGQLNVDVEVRDLAEKTDNLSISVMHNVKLMEEISPLEDELAGIEGVEGEAEAERRTALKSQIQDLSTKWQVLEEIKLPTIESTELNDKDIKTKTQLLKQIKSLYGANLSSPEIAASLISSEQFREANQEPPQDSVLDLHLADPEADLAKMDLNNDLAESSGLALFQLVDSFDQGLEQAMLDGGTKMGICEYIMDKYTFATSQTKRGHYFELGEAEYIICGNASELTNVGEMFLKIFVIRLAIDTLDAFLKSLTPHPVARLVEALVVGFGGACRDMVNLYAGLPTALCPSVPQPTLAYSDYVRLFLLLQDKNTQLDRMRQLIQVDVRSSNKEFTLQQHSGSFTVQAEVSINLLFLPALHLDKLGFPGFTPDRYIIVKEAVMGY